MPRFGRRDTVRRLPWIGQSFLTVVLLATLTLPSKTSGSVKDAGGQSWEYKTDRELDTAPLSRLRQVPLSLTAMSLATEQGAVPVFSANLTMLPRTINQVSNSGRPGGSREVPAI